MKFTVDQKGSTKEDSKVLWLMKSVAGDQNKRRRMRYMCEGGGQWTVERRLAIEKACMGGRDWEPLVTKTKYKKN
jgi:hypothetical protein